MKALILAGGLGTRLRPVTFEIPKPLITVKKKPILNHLVKFFCVNGVSDVSVLINEDHKEDYEWWRKRYKKELPQIKLHFETKPLGTFGGVKLLKRHFKEDFVLSNGDELKDFDLKSMIKFHKTHKAKPVATIALTKVSNPSIYGVPLMSGARITDFLEKPENPSTDFVSSGIYVLSPKVFDYAPRDQEFVMIEKDIFPRLAAEEKLLGYKAKNYRWFPCDNLERWEAAIEHW
ncbi:MAG: nucleotidyltransferase family protein [Candidatus Liptonbacteria bacterium]|nr:nucleotidyltransferase family protein [Candidatus Liptonbacteria bacterium]